MTYGNTAPDAPQQNPQQQQVSQVPPTTTQSSIPSQNPQPQNQSKPNYGNGKALLAGAVIVIILIVAGVLYYVHSLSSQPSNSSSYTIQSTQVVTNTSKSTSNYSNSSVKSSASQNQTYYINRNISQNKTMPIMQFENIVDANYSSGQNINVSYALFQNSSGTEVNIKLPWNATFERYQNIYYYKAKIGFGGNSIIIDNGTSAYICAFTVCRTIQINSTTESLLASQGIAINPTPISMLFGQSYEQYAENTTLQFTSVQNSTYNGLPCLLITGNEMITHVPKNGTTIATIVNNTEKISYYYTNQTKPFSLCMSPKYYLPLNLSFQVPGPYPGEISGHYIVLNANANSSIGNVFASNTSTV